MSTTTTTHSPRPGSPFTAAHDQPLSEKQEFLTDDGQDRQRSKQAKEAAMMKQRRREQQEARRVRQEALDLVVYKTFVGDPF
ncbi:hypothetical protein BGZ73_003656 [Actinomortierella ambigua]|nr:hypothetical protein BGZ73_003656 [Actinomortierella ambigua]